MRCAQCHEREATIHFTLVMGTSTDVTSHALCESCYPDFAMEHTKTYNTRPNSPLPADVERITAEEYLEAREKTTRNGVDIPAFKHIQKELRRLPATQQRLVFEMFPLAWQALERGEEPFWESSFNTYWNSIESECLPAFTAWLEKIIVLCFELRSQLPNPQSEHGKFSVTLSGALISLAKVDRTRFSDLLARLKCQCNEASGDARMKLLNRVEKLVSKSEER